MSAKVSITLDEEVLEFVDRSSQNRSQFINKILSQAKKSQLLKELEEAYIELANDPQYQTVRLMPQRKRKDRLFNCLFAILSLEKWLNLSKKTQTFGGTFGYSAPYGECFCVLNSPESL